MILPKVRIRKHITIYGLNRLPLRIEPARLKELVFNLRHKLDIINTKREIIIGHIRMGTSIASSYNLQHEDGDELFGVMQLALVETVDLFIKRPPNHDNITGLITIKIHSYLKDFVGDKVFGVPIRTVRHWNTKLDERVRRLPTKVGTVSEDFISDEKIDDSNQSVRTLRKSVLVVVPHTVDDHKDLEIKEVLDACTYDWWEKKIIELKSEGYTLEEIGDAVGYSKSKTQEILKKIEERFFARYGKIG